jgi:hypothetical protein
LQGIGRVALWLKKVEITVRRDKMRLNLKAILLTVAPLLIAPSVQAGPDNRPRYPERGEVTEAQEQAMAENAGNYITLSFGNTSYATSMLNSSALIYGDDVDERKAAGTSTGLTFGHRFNTGLAVELGHVDYGKTGMLFSVTGTYGDSISYTRSSMRSIEATAIQVACVANPSLNDWLALKLMLGIEKWNTEVSLINTYWDSDDILNSEISIRREEGADPFLGMGLLFSLPYNIDLSLAYDHHYFVIEETRYSARNSIEIKQTKILVEINF